MSLKKKFSTQKSLILAYPGNFLAFVSLNCTLNISLTRFFFLNMCIQGTQFIALLKFISLLPNKLYFNIQLTALSI